MWNLPGGPTDPSIVSVERLLRARAPKEDLGYDPLDFGHGARSDSAQWRRELSRAPFEPLGEVRLPNPQSVDRGGLVAFFASMGWIADLPSPVRLPLLDEVRALLTADGYSRPWETHLYWTRRRRRG
jgi:hypothetical protein